MARNDRPDDPEPAPTEDVVPPTASPRRAARDVLWIPLIGALTLALVVLANLAIPAGHSAKPGAVAAATTPPQPRHALFVGNSQTYVGNLPAVFAALARANGHPFDAAMLARGGETLSEHLADPRLAAALATKRYELVVAQERGGDLIGGFGDTAAAPARSAAAEIAAASRASGAQPILLGTWQPNPPFSQRLDEAESGLAADLHEAHAAVSEPLRRALARHPARDWYAVDGMHPGRLLVLLQAVSVYHAAFASWPKVADVHVDAFNYGIRTRFSTDTPTSEPLAGQEFEHGIDYRAEEVGWMVEALRGPDAG